MTDPAPDETRDAVAAELAAKRAELEAELAELTAGTPEASGISFGKRVGEGTALAVERLSQVAAHDRLQAMLAEVRRAEEKLAAGSYGRCDACGNEIAPARLEALPWAVRCVSCSARR